MGGQQKSQWNRKRQHPLPYRHPRDDVIYQVSRRFGHAPCPTGGAEPAPFTRESHQLLMGAVWATAKSENLRQAVLKQAFSGRLVKQDENDEPASILLERIRSAKPSVVGKARRNKKKEKVA